MTSLNMQVVFSGIAVGVAIALIVTLFGRRRLTPAIGSALVFVLCLVYHVLAAYSMNFQGLEIIGMTVMVPLIFGFGGLFSFVIALGTQATLAGIVGAGLYWIINRGI